MAGLTLLRHRRKPRSDAMLFMCTAKDLDYNPKLLVAQNAG